jgi:HEAT repeat protein
MKTQVRHLALSVSLLGHWALLPVTLAAQSPDEKLAAIEKRLADLEAKLERLLQLTGDAKPQAPGPKYRGRSLPSWLQDLGDREDGVRRTAAAALRHVGEDALPLLRAALKDEDWLLRREAIDLLGATRFLPETWEEIAGLLNDPNPRVRLEVVERLSGLKELEATPETKKAVDATLPALKDALKDASEAVQIAAAGALVLLGNDEVRAGIPAPLLEKALAASAVDRNVLARAPPAALESQIALGLARTLVRRGPEGARAALPALLRLLESSHLRLETAVILGEIGPAAREAVPTLQEMFLSYQDSVESFAEEGESARKGGKSRKRTVLRIVSEDEAARAAEAVKQIGDALEKIEKGAAPAERE